MGLDADDLPDAEEFELSLDDMNLSTLSGDMRDRMLTPFRQARKLWTSMSELEQQDYANGIDLAAKSITRKAVQMLLDRPFPRIVARLGDVAIKGGEKARIESKLIAPLLDEYLGTMGKNVGKEVLVFVVSAEEFLGEKAPVKVDPDEPELPMARDDGDGPDDPDGGSPDGDLPDGDPAEGEQDPGTSDTDRDGVAPDEEADAQANVDRTDPDLNRDTEAEEVAAIAAEAFPGATVVTYADGEGPADLDQIRKDAEDFEASAAELESQTSRAKLIAERAGGTTEPKARRSRKTVTA